MARWVKPVVLRYAPERGSIYGTTRVSFYATHKADFLSPSNSSPSSSDQLIRTALRTHPTILFLHGNGGTRVLQSRIQDYQPFASRLCANVFAPDYRGYADSTGTPSETRLALDSRASWDWLRFHGAATENVLIVGNSPGTAVAVIRAACLCFLHGGRSTRRVRIITRCSL